MNIKRIIACTVSTLIAASMSTISAFAEDFSFDMTKARPTYGGGQAYTSYTRLDNERRDKNNFNPLWLTENSTFEIEYTTEGDFINAPVRLILQSWTGELVDSKEDKWIPIEPTSFDDTKAVWDYDTLVAAYGSDFSDVYSLVIGDGDMNSLTVKSMIATNLDIPDSELYSVTNGSILDNGKPVSQPEVTEADASDETVKETSSDEEKDNTETQTDKKSDNNKTEDKNTESLTNNLYVIILGAVVIILVITLAVIIIKNKIKAKRGGWH